ncbi:hypothetical protein EASAB2608_07751 [Streptomyces sp. EAS-AB2608]|nr:hypothetical protein EASAB2608_07751 [Streptomyces sp. EAS-AB2608]
MRVPVAHVIVNVAVLDEEAGLAYAPVAQQSMRDRTEDQDHRGFPVRAVPFLFPGGLAAGA